MGFDLDALRRAVAAHGRVARVVVAGVAGSTPREVGAAMLVWEGGQSGTIGGGALEFEAAQQAFSRRGLSRHPLGPALGQCCGGAVTLLTESFEQADLDRLAGRDVIARGPGDMPLGVQRLLSRARARGTVVVPQLVGNWFVEPVTRADLPVWVWGAGHVGRALVSVLHPLPGVGLTWVDTGMARFPEDCPPEVRVLPAPDMPRAVALAPEEAAHLVVTYSHALDLALCDALLRHGFGFAGLIGSESKWARFRARLCAMGHGDGAIARITCPIGQKELGKHPQAIAVGVASQLLSLQQKQAGVSCPTFFSASTA